MVEKEVIQNTENELLKRWPMSHVTWSELEFVELPDFCFLWTYGRNMHVSVEQWSVSADRHGVNR